MVDRVTSELVYIINRAEDGGCRSDAVKTLLNMLPALDEESIDRVIADMTWFICNSHDESRRKAAQDVLVILKNVKSIEVS